MQLQTSGSSTYLVSEDLIKPYISALQDTAVNFGLFEREEGSIIDYSNTAVFELFLFWLHQGELPASMDFDNVPHEYPDELRLAGEYMETLVHLWCFADRFGISGLQNAAMRMLLKYLTGRGTTYNLIRSTLNEVKEDCVVWNAIFDVYAQNLMNGFHFECDELDMLGALPSLFRETLHRIARYQVSVDTVPEVEVDAYMV